MHCEWQGQYLMVICHKSELGAEVSIFRNNVVANRPGVANSKLGICLQ